MKKIFCLLLFLMFLPFQSVAEEQQQCEISYDYWMCYQVGSINEEVVLVVSNIILSQDSVCSNSRVNKFQKIIKKVTEDRFVPAFSPRCEDYKSIKKAKEDFKDKVEIAKKRNLRIFHIKFSE